MKKVPFCFSLLSLLILANSYGRVHAAACATGAVGVVTVTIPTLPSAGRYNIWTRMQVPDETRNRYRLDVNGDSCFEVGGSSLVPGQWTWVSFQDGDLSSKVAYNFTNKSGNKLKLIGTDGGVKLDQVLVVKNDCVPVDQGANCQTDVAPEESFDTTGATVLPPSGSGLVSGIIIPSPTITQNKLAIIKVVYYVDSKQIPTASNYGLDTTLLSNGVHQLSIQITKADGTLTNEATTITTKNPETPFTPLRRWSRLNRGTVVMMSSIIGVLLLFATVFLAFRHIKLQKRLLSFHGF